MRITPAVKVILIINIVFYVLSYWVTPLFPLGGHGDWFVQFNALHPIGYSGFAVYQYLTYMFMHGGWWHLFFNMWSLMIFGNAVEQQVGTKRFVYYYLLCGVGSALINQLCTALGIIAPAQLVGASGAIYGVMAAAAFFFPNARLFIIPIPFPIKLKYLVGFYTVVEMYMGIVSVDGVAHFAHLGGILVGIAILFCWRMQDKKQQKRGRENYWTTSTSNQSHYEKEEGLWEKLKQFFVGKRQPKMRVTNVREANYADHMYNERKRQESDEIDRILDKIRRNGYQNLSESEKATLFNASKRKQEEQGR
ncbi:MAG: rhomboid family intramembrane serine protease [Bacteroidaceae bacterium]|nr:rhomboid family intramembrane serine protease [Bacteroidaceae bacterium]MBR1520321.1 rhomboid family intramembrane serine protease [Bacteroidaceae bacterium]